MPASPEPTIDPAPEPQATAPFAAVAPVAVESRRTLARWTGILARFLSLQVATQVITLLSGLLLVRSLSVIEFGRYTIATTLQGTTSMLADSGMTSVVLSIGGRVHGDRHRFGRLIQTGIAFRRRLEVMAFLLAGPLLAFLLHRNGGAVVDAVVVGLALAMTIHSQVAGSLYSVVPLLHLQHERVQRAQFVGAVVRLALVGAVVLLGRGYWAAVWAAAGAFAIQAAVSRYYAKMGAELEVPPHPEDAAEMRQIFRTQLFPVIYYAFEPQISVWLISFFGDPRALGEVGALGRLSAMFAVVGALLTSLVSPRLARYQDPKVLLRRYVQAFSAVVVLGAGVVAFAAAFPGVMLWVLGKQYAHLHQEVVLVVGATVFTLLVTTLYTLNSSRAWIRGVWLAIPFTLGLQVLMLSRMQLNTVSAVITFSLLSQIPPFLVNAGLGVRGLLGEFRNQHENDCTNG